MKLIEFSILEKEESTSNYINSDYVNSSAPFFQVTLILTTTDFDTDYTVAMLRNLVCESYRVLAYSNKELEGEPYKPAWTFNNSFWIKLDNGNYQFSEYFENNSVVKEILRSISNIVNNPSLNLIEDNVVCDLFRLLKALEQFWD